MIEKLKSLLLVALTISALFLAQKILMINHIEKQDIKLVDSNFKDKYLVSDIASPKKIIVNFKNGMHTVLYDEKKQDIWSELPKILETIFEATTQDIESFTALSDEQYKLLMNKFSLVLDFNESTPLGTFLNMLELKTNKKPAERWVGSDRVYISLEDNNFVVFTVKNRHIMVNFKKLNTDKLKKHVSNLEIANNYTAYNFLGDKHGINSFILVPDYKNFHPKEIYMENIIKDFDQQYINNLVTNFTGKPVNYLKALTEEDGKRIFVDEPKILKIYESGKLAFFDPDQPEIIERNFNLSLDTALNFIYNRVGFDKNLYLSDIEKLEFEQKQGYKFKFSIEDEGYPIKIIDKEFSDYLEVDVFNTSVRRFVQIFRVAKELTGYKIQPKDAIDIEKIIFFKAEEMASKLSEEFKREYDATSDIDKTKFLIENIKDINIAYLDDLYGSEDNPSKVAYEIIFDAKKFYYDIYSGQLILER